MMMNKKGQVEIGGFIMIAIVAIVGAILLVASAQNIDPVRNTQSIENFTYTVGENNTNQSIPGQAIVGTVTVTNQTGANTIDGATFREHSNQVVDGTLTARLEYDDTTDSGLIGEAVNISYNSQPDGYATSGGARALTGIIIVFFALAIAVVVLVPTLKSKLLEGMGK